MAGSITRSSPQVCTPDRQAEQARAGRRCRAQSGPETIGGTYKAIAPHGPAAGFAEGASAPQAGAEEPAAEGACVRPARATDRPTTMSESTHVTTLGPIARVRH